jgi:hypothetical protein
LGVGIAINIGQLRKVTAMPRSRTAWLTASAAALICLAPQAASTAAEAAPVSPACTIDYEVGSPWLANSKTVKIAGYSSCSGSNRAFRLQIFKGSRLIKTGPMWNGDAYQNLTAPCSTGTNSYRGEIIEYDTTSWFVAGTKFGFPLPLTC